MSISTQDIKNRIDEEFVVSLLEEYGSDHRIDSSGSYIFRTVCHGGTKPKLYYYPSSQRFCCYTHCHDMDIFDLVQKHDECDFRTAKAFICNRLGIDDADREKARRSGFNHQGDDAPLSEKERHENFLNYVNHSWIPQHNLENRPNPVLEEMDYDFHDCRKNRYYDEWEEKEGISRIVMQYEFELCSYPKIYPEDAIVFPCKDIDGRLIGARRRLITTEPDCWELGTSKYGFFPPKKTFEISKYLYGIYQNQYIIQEEKMCVLFEGEKSVMKAASMYENGIFPCVAVLGQGISEDQLTILKNLGVEEVVVAFDYDDDDSCAVYMQKARIIRSYGFKATVLFDGYSEFLEKKDAPIDKGKEIFEILLSRRVLSRG